MSGTKIRMVRESRGYSQEYVASKIDLDQSSYSRLESNQTKLDVDTLTKLADVLGVPAADLLTSEPAVVNFAPNQGTQGIGHIENFYSFQKDLVEKVINSKDQEIASLKEVIGNLVKDKEELIKLLTSKK
ncbi:MAG: helix-turn-helix domain-containing protein [Sphingobacteriales bacterium]